MPTYKEWKNKTLKKSIIEIDTNNMDTNMDTNNIDINNIDTNNIDINNIDTNNKNKRLNNQTLKYNLGKKDRKVTILVKNSETRKRISKEHKLLKQENIFEMKKYLKKQNLLKSGSHAPPDVIKKMYEQSLLSGDIQNSNKNNIIYNYLAE